MKKVLVGVLFLISLVSCTVTKRVHNPGFHIQWNANHKNVNTNNETNVVQLNEENNISDEAVKNPELIIENSPEEQNIDEIIDVPILEKQVKKPLSTLVVPISDKEDVEEFSGLKSAINKLKNINYKSILKKKDRKEKTGSSRIGLIIIILFLGILLALALFAANPLARIAAIILLVLGILVILIGLFLICWIVWFILFSWWS